MQNPSQQTGAFPTSVGRVWGLSVWGNSDGVNFAVVDVLASVGGTFLCQLVTVGWGESVLSRLRRNEGWGILFWANSIFGAACRH